MSTQRAPTTAEERVSLSWRGRTGVVLLLALLGLQLWYAARTTSATMDEPYSIVSGLTALRTGDYRFSADHPPLMSMVVGAAAHLAGAAPLPMNRDWAQGLRMKYAYFYLWTGPNAPRAVRLVAAARYPVIALSLALALLVFLWARQLYGARAGLLALALYCFEPNLLAHAAVATFDLGLTAAFCYACYAYWRHWRTGRLRYLALTGLAVGAAAAIKVAGLLLVAVLPALLIVVWRKEKPGTARSIAAPLAILFVLAVLLVWTVYRFSLAPSSAEPGALRVPLGQYCQAIAFQAQHQATGHKLAPYLLGMRSDTGWWYYFIVAFLVKTTVPLLLLLGLAFSRGKLDHDEWFLVLPAGLLFAAALIQHLDLGIRYLLPAYPLLIILVGRTLTRPWPEEWRAWPKRAVVALAVWAAAEAQLYAPNYLSYFNELVGGPSHGSAVLADSNVDWGQDLYALAAWQRRHPEVKPLYFAYFGPADITRYGVHATRLPDFGPKDPPRSPEWIDREGRPRTGWIAVSVNCLKLRSTYQWLEPYRPVDRAGYSILIYHITGPAEIGTRPRARGGRWVDSAHVGEVAGTVSGRRSA